MIIITLDILFRFTTPNRIVSTAIIFGVNSVMVWNNQNRVGYSRMVKRYCRSGRLVSHNLKLLSNYVPTRKLHLVETRLNFTYDEASFLNYFSATKLHPSDKCRRVVNHPFRLQWAIITAANESSWRQWANIPAAEGSKRKWQLQ